MRRQSLGDNESVVLECFHVLLESNSHSVKIAGMGLASVVSGQVGIFDDLLLIVHFNDVLLQLVFGPSGILRQLHVNMGLLTDGTQSFLISTEGLLGVGSILGERAGLGNLDGRGGDESGGDKSESHFVVFRVGV